MQNFTTTETPGEFSGYAIVFNQTDHDNDIFLPGSFSKCLETLKLHNIKLLWQHNQEKVIGLYKKIYEDQYGLFVTGQIFLNLKQGFEAYTLIKNKAINGLSIGFKIKDYHHDNYSGARIIVEAELWEISLVTFPAQQHAQIQQVKQNINGLKKQITQAHNQFLN